jgi:hypothetical protein
VGLKGDVLDGWAGVGVLHDEVSISEARFDVAPSLRKQVNDVRALETGLAEEHVWPPTGEGSGPGVQDRRLGRQGSFDVEDRRELLVLDLDEI